MSFFECELPRTFSFLSTGGPTWSTTINAGLSGSEGRNRNWANQRGEWEISLKTPKGFDGNRQSFVDLLRAFFDVVGGRADGFRLWDPLDNTALSQPLVTVTGGVQLAITRTLGSRSYVQLISKPIAPGAIDFQGHALPNTVFLAGTNTPVTVDYTTGLVSGPGAGTHVDFQFHYPVRFDVDKLKFEAQPSAVGAGRPIIQWGSVPLIEVVPPNF